MDEVCHFYGRPRLQLPAVDLEALFPGFTDAPVTLTRLPLGEWSSPTSAQVVLVKIARLIRARRILEIGSFRGYTARLCAENLPDANIVALDNNPKHGEAYLGSELASRIVRVTGTVDDLTPGSEFDLIYVDAHHTREAVTRDTQAALTMLAEGGVVGWDDYADWGWASELNRVPEVLNSLAKTVPIGRVVDLALAIHRRGWTQADIEAGAIRSDGSGQVWVAPHYK